MDLKKDKFNAGGGFGAAVNPNPLLTKPNHRSIAIDADLFVPENLGSSYDMSYFDLGFFGFVASLIEQGHDVEFVVANEDEIDTATGFLERHRKKSDHMLLGEFSVKSQDQMAKADVFDVLISNRPDKLSAITGLSAVQKTSKYVQDHILGRVAHQSPRLRKH